MLSSNKTQPLAVTFIYRDISLPLKSTVKMNLSFNKSFMSAFLVHNLFSLFLPHIPQCKKIVSVISNSRILFVIFLSSFQVCRNSLHTHWHLDSDVFLLVDVNPMLTIYACNSIRQTTAKLVTWWTKTVLDFNCHVIFTCVCMKFNMRK